MKSIKKIIAVLFSLILVFTIFACKKTVTIGTKSLDVSKNYTIFISQSSESEALNEMRRGFVKAMVQKGFVENVNVTYIYENAKSDKNLGERIGVLAYDKKPDLIVTIGEMATLTMLDKVKDIPVVFLGCLNAEKVGLCDKNSMPLLNATGVRGSHLLDETLAYISSNYSNVKKLGVIYNVNNALSSYDIDFLKFYATGYDIDIYTVGIKKEADIDAALNNIMPKVDAMTFIVDEMVISNKDKVINRCLADKKPIFGQTDLVDSTNIIVPFDADKEKVGAEGADIASSLLKGKEKLKDIKIRDIDYK